MGKYKGKLLTKCIKNILKIILVNFQAAVKEFLSIYKHGMLPRGELFSLYYPQLLREMSALFKLFYHAKDFDIFFKTALWAKNNINEAQYIYSLYTAVITRPDTKFIQLPPLYEMCPYFFFNSEVLQKANHALIFGKLGNTYVFKFSLIAQDEWWFPSIN